MNVVFEIVKPKYLKQQTNTISHRYMRWLNSTHFSLSLTFLTFNILLMSLSPINNSLLPFAFFPLYRFWSLAQSVSMNVCLASSHYSSSIVSLGLTVCRYIIKDLITSKEVLQIKEGYIGMVTSGMRLHL